MRTQQDPIAGDKVEAFTAHLEGSLTGKHDDPLVVSFVIVKGRRQRAAQNVLNDDAAELSNLLVLLTDARRFAR